MRRFRPKSFKQFFQTVNSRFSFFSNAIWECRACTFLAVEKEEVPANQQSEVTGKRFSI